MRRAAIGVVILILLIALGIWWTERNAIRIEPYDARRFARMSEAQQVEWLIKQLLARTERTRSSRWKEVLDRWLGRTPPKRNLLDYQKSLNFTEIKTIGTLSLQYELPHLLPHLNAYADSEYAFDLIQACESMHDARRRDWRNARRRIDRIHTPAVRAYALAALAKHQHDAGLTQQAQQSQQEAIQWLEQSKPHDALGYEDALRTLLQLDAVRREPQTVAKLTAHVDPLHEYLAQIVADAYRQRGELNLLRAYMQALPPKLRQDVKPALAVALIEAGQIEAGVRQLRGLTIAPTELLAVADALHKQHRPWMADVYQLIVQGSIEGNWQLRTQARQRQHAGADPIVERTTTSTYMLVPIGTELDFELSFQYNLVQTYLMLLRTYVEVNQIDRIESLLSTLQSHARVSPDDWTFLLMIHTRLHLAAAYYQAGRKSEAQRQVENALQDLRQAKDLGDVAYSVRALRRAGAETLARAFLQGAREYALSVQDANLRSSLIASLAPAYALNGQIPEATEAAMRLPTVEQQRAVLRAVLGAMAE